MSSPAPRVLVADDEDSIRLLLLRGLRRAGFDLCEARDGQEAIEHLDAGDFDALVLDLMMPRVDGFGVIEYVKAHPGPQKPVVLVITAYADQKFKQVDPNVVTGVVRKPFEVAELGNLVRLCVDGYDQVRTESFEETARKWHIPQGQSTRSGNGDGAH